MTERLKQARESRGLSVRQIAETTKVSTRVVSALEEGRLDIVPEGVYRRSLVRLIAAEVGLPPEETLRTFLEEHPDDLPTPGSPIHAEPQVSRPSGGWRRLLAMLGAIAPLLAGVAFFAQRDAAPATSAASGVAERREAGSWQPEIVPAGGFLEAPPPATRPVTMLITFSEACQLHVFADGGLVVGRNFAAGESLRVAFSESIELSGDNAGAVQYSINGRAGRMLGADGTMLSVRIGRDDYSFYLSEY